jgi:hypothetical protein
MIYFQIYNTVVICKHNGHFKFEFESLVFTMNRTVLRCNSQRKSNKMQHCIKIFISYLYEAQHVSGDTPPIIRSLKLHKQSLVLHMWRTGGCVVGGHCQSMIHCCNFLDFLVNYTMMHGSTNFKY